MVVQDILLYFIQNDFVMALYAYHPPFITPPLRGKPKVQAMKYHIEHQQEVLQLLKDNLVIVQNVMTTSKLINRWWAYGLSIPSILIISTKRNILYFVITLRMKYVLHCDLFIGIKTLFSTSLHAWFATTNTMSSNVLPLEIPIMGFKKNVFLQEYKLSSQCFTPSN